jgi:integrase
MANTRRTKGEGSAYMRKDGRAAASIRYEGKRITKYGKTKTEAKQKLDAYLADLRSGKLVLGPKQTVKQYLEYWLENVHRLKIERTTLDRYRTVLRVHLIPAFGHLQLSQLTREQVQAFYVAKLDGGLSPRRIDTIHAVLSAALRDAVKHKILAQNVCEYVTLPKKQKHKPHVLTPEECTRLVEAARGHRLWFLLLLALTTGARLGELCALHWEDMDLGARRVHIHRNCARVRGVGLIEKAVKTASGARKVALPQVVLDGLEEQRAYVASLRDRAGSHWRELDLVFPNKQGGYLNPDQVREELSAVLVEAGIDRRRFHDLRHSAATLLFAAGLNPKVVAEMLGHSSVSITLGLYGDVLPDMQQEVADVMDRLFEK